jgi:hypothetical protein
MYCFNNCYDYDNDGDCNCAADDGNPFPSFPKWHGWWWRREKEKQAAREVVVISEEVGTTG